MTKAFFKRTNTNTATQSWSAFVGLESLPKTIIKTGIKAAMPKKSNIERANTESATHPAMQRSL